MRAPGRAGAGSTATGRAPGSCTSARGRSPRVHGRGPGMESGVRRASAMLVLLALLSLLLASGAEAKRVSFPAKRVHGQTVAFRIGGIRVVEVRGATVRAGRYRRA